jgi:glycosyltransferase involved in cell wall biosynthesis
VAGTDRRVQVLHPPLKGKSRALNWGIPQTRGRWLVLIDDDIIACPGWLQALSAEVVMAGPRATVAGRVKPGEVAPGMAQPPATWDDDDPAEFCGRVNRDLMHPNFAMPPAAFSELHGFDERLGPGTGMPSEDNDFAYRLLRAGWRILYRPAPTVIHRAWRSPAHRHAVKKSYGIGQGAFYAKHLAALDPFIAYRCMRDILGTSRAAGGALLRGWPAVYRGHMAFLGGLFIGLWRMTSLILRGTPARKTI